MFSPEFSAIHQSALDHAQRLGHSLMTSEHLLWHLLDDDKVSLVLKECQIEQEKIKEHLTNYFQDYLISKENVNPKPTKSVQRIIQRAIYQVQASQTQQLVAPSDVLVAIFKESDCFANQLLQDLGLDILTLTKTISRLDRQEFTEKLTQDDATQETKINPLTAYTTNLNEQVQLGKIDPLVGRDDEIERAIQILCRRRKNNPLFVGDAGVGKTAIVEGLAWKIVHQQVPSVLAQTTIYSLDIGSLVAGTKFRGDFEKRIKNLLDILKNKPDVILFIDEIHMMIGAGASNDGNVDVSNLIKPALSRGELRCIGSTTFVEYRQLFEKDHALSRRFQKIDVKEPSVAEAIQILQGLKKYYENFHQVTYTDEAIEAAVKLSVKHLHERFLPDKAIDVIDEAGAYLRLNPKNEQMVDSTLIETIIAKMARIPPSSIANDDKRQLAQLEHQLKQVVFGQDRAVEVLSDTIKLSKAGLGNPNKPIGSFLFTGPTGVGKTELAKQLAFMLGVEFVRFDMSEYMESHTASRLIGAPPGYVGYDQGGLLTEKIQQFPHCVLLLDELEKAHPDVFNLLLQVMDNGMLTDNNGRTVSFRQVILIMTSNVGADSISRQSMGFTEQNHQHDNGEAIKRTFTPEFRNRLDAMVNFEPLSPMVMDFVVDKFVSELQEMLLAKNVVLTVDKTAREYLAKHGYDRLMGARPMARLIQDKLKKPLASMILFGELADGGQVSVLLDEAGEISFKVS